ncbi:NDT80/PhoG-like DNA-binding family protein [Aspergillus clavatus NRRL 1]|uniref:NDT80 / PhoG like DNA-binding family protein n=1 Tax=Aspergillus clavatus (strain ATCC 1007 / CBS 513.65 / DSM 816 / NCTC 3887 / NRRL 1 / QM 1276 / 107) TaxID=344612 RepID=A1C3U2_ASPCL|nr:NDT80 / PhoG like DNA-binding family protein [Aspergillus clavatus NRRL 1]EAW15082.1 NDT80 / PhoG like DNA-binding family protein [Aspergillus clavatus NRRL 1]
MEGFDTMAMPYLASPLSLGNIQGADYLNAMPGIDIPEQRSNFDSDTFVSGEDIPYPQHNLPATLKRFPSGYEDPFTEMVTPFAPTPSEQPADSSIDHNHKLLCFSIPVYNFTLLDYSLRRTSISLSAQLHGMFFLAESPWTTSPTENAPPQQGAELTCYRRNLFQITGSVTLPRSLRYIMTEQGDRIPILAHELAVSATESVEGNSVKIISVPWKTPAANSNPLPDDSGATSNNAKVEKEPPAIPLDTMAGQDLDTDYATFPIAWKRLQFRVATANNGRRKELQQHFVVRLKVIATLSTGAKIPICEVHSGPVIVRGRSPRNFQSRKDLPLSGSAAASRKSAQAAALNRTPTTESIPRTGLSAAKAKSAVKSASPETTIPQAVVGPRQQSSPDWTHIPQSSGGTLSSAALPQSSVYPQSNPEFSRPDSQRRSSAMAAPINLSLLDDDNTGEAVSLVNPTDPTSYTNDVSQRHHEIGTSAPPAKMRKLSHGVSHAQSRSTSTSLPLLNTAGLQQPFASTLPFPNESADLLYEYFPLGLDDWQAPVDAVYRPHVVHHTNMPEMKFVAARGRSKRYFAAEDVF